MKTGHAWVWVVAFAVVLSCSLALPAAARVATSIAGSDIGAGSIALPDPAQPPGGTSGTGTLSGTGDSDGDPDDIMGGNNVVKGPVNMTTSSTTSSVRVILHRSLFALMRAWMLVTQAR